MHRKGTKKGHAEKHAGKEEPLDTHCASTHSRAIPNAEKETPKHTEKKFKAHKHRRSQAHYECTYARATSNTPLVTVRELHPSAGADYIYIYIYTPRSLSSLLNFDFGKSEEAIFGSLQDYGLLTT